MTTTHKVLPGLLLMFSALALCGCESDGSRSIVDSLFPTAEDPETNPPAPPAPPPPAAAINADNAGALASGAFLALDSSSGTASSMDIGNAFLLGCANVGVGTATPTGTGIGIDLVLEVGESFGMDFVDCEDGAGLTLDGSVLYTATAVTGIFLFGDPADDWSVTFSVDFVDFTATQGAQTESLDETYTLVLSYDGTTTELTSSLDGETVVFTGGSVVFNNLSYEETGTDYELSLDATLSVDGQSGTLSLVTLQPLIGPIAGNPESGVVLIAASDDSTLTLTFTGGGGVTVEIDENDDGTPDCSQDLTFDTLDQFDPALCT
jgi:hypothetical protein